MAVEENSSGNLPTDLIIDIFSRLPSTSIARFHCLSKQWASTLGCPCFSELFLTQSKTRPRLLFGVQRYDKWLLYSSLQPQNSSTDPNSSLSVTAEFLMSIPRRSLLHISAPLLVLICRSTDVYSPMLCNLSTRHLLRLPQLTGGIYSYFGYDPIHKQFSVLTISYPLVSHQTVRYQIIKLGSGRLSWRDIESPLNHYPLHLNICINGILYFIVNFGIRNPRKAIGCFGLNSEEFKFIDEPSWGQPEFLVNFKGKLGGITKKWKSGSNLEVSLWVLEDMENQEWSKHVFLLPTLWSTKFPHISLDGVMVGVTATGEITVSLSTITNPFYVYFFNIEKNSLREIEIKGFERFKFGTHLKGCVDYVEDLKGLNWS